MKITILKQDLQSALNTVRGVVASKVSIPILSYILLETKDNAVKVTGTDLKVTIECTVDCTVHEPGSLTLMLHRISMLLSELPDQEITIELLENGIVNLVCGVVDTKFFSIFPEEFPPVKEFDTVLPIVFKQCVLKKLFQRTSYAICTDQSRANLTGVLFEVKSGELRVVATDGRRLSYALCDEEIAGCDDIRVIIPAKMVHELESLLSDDDEKSVNILIDQTKAAFVFDNVRIITSLIEGNFPNYEVVIPKKYDKEIVIGHEPFLRCMRRAAAMTNDKFRNVRLIFDAGLLKIFVKTPDVGEYEEEIPVDYDGQKLEIAFNPFFILDVLRYIDSEHVYLQFKDSGSPGVIKPYLDGPINNYINVIMPINIK